MDLNELKKRFNSTNLSDLKKSSTQNEEKISENEVEEVQEGSNSIKNEYEKISLIDQTERVKKEVIEPYVGNTRYDNKDYPYAVSYRKRNNEKNNVINDIEIRTIPKAKIDRNDRIAYVTTSNDDNKTDYNNVSFKDMGKEIDYHNCSFRENPIDEDIKRDYINNNFREDMDERVDDLLERIYSFRKGW